ncbi:Lamin-C [Formica fusca]
MKKELKRLKTIATDAPEHMNEEIQRISDLKNQKLAEADMRQKIAISEIEKRLAEQYEAKVEHVQKELKTEYKAQLLQIQQEIELIYENQRKNSAEENMKKMKESLQTGFTVVQ